MELTPREQHLTEQWRSTKGNQNENKITVMKKYSLLAKEGN